MQCEEISARCKGELLLVKWVTIREWSFWAILLIKLAFFRLFWPFFHQSGHSGQGDQKWYFEPLSVNWHFLTLSGLFSLISSGHPALYVIHATYICICSTIWWKFGFTCGSISQQHQVQTLLVSTRRVSLMQQQQKIRPLVGLLFCSLLLS